jgi:hypothetical protein
MMAAIIATMLIYLKTSSDVAGIPSINISSVNTCSEKYGVNHPQMATIVPAYRRYASILGNAGIFFSAPTKRWGLSDGYDSILSYGQTSIKIED